MNLETVNFKLSNRAATAICPQALDSLSPRLVGDSREMRMLRSRMETATAFFKELMRQLHGCVWTIRVFGKKQPVLRSD